MYLVDTDVLSALRRRSHAPGPEAWIAAQRATDLFISVITIGEIERGIALKRQKEPKLAQALSAWLDHVLALYGERILPFDIGASRRWGQLSAAVGNKNADIQIAATALEHGLTLATGNVKHYARAGIPVVNPFDHPARR